MQIVTQLTVVKAICIAGNNKLEKSTQMLESYQAVEWVQKAEWGG